MRFRVTLKIFKHKLTKHYKKLKIDPLTKTAIFSDGLDFGKALNIANTYKNSIQTSFGIGTNLTNDVGLTPLQIVIKLADNREA